MRRGLGFSHPLASQFPVRITPSRQLDILNDLLRGEKWAIDETILGHMRYACALVTRYLATSGNRDEADDLSEAAFYGIVDGVNAIVRNGLSHENVTGYLALRIHGEIRNYFDGKFSVVKTPRGDAQTQDESIVDKSYGPDNTIEIEECINTISKDPTDESIIRQLQIGYSPSDVARNLGVGRSCISKRISRIQLAYKELQNE